MFVLNLMFQNIKLSTNLLFQYALHFEIFYVISPQSEIIMRGYYTQQVLVLSSPAWVRHQNVLRRILQYVQHLRSCCVPEQFSNLSLHTKYYTRAHFYCLSSERYCVHVLSPLPPHHKCGDDFGGKFSKAAADDALTLFQAHASG